MAKSGDILFIVFSLKPGGTQRMMVNVLNEISTENKRKILYLYNYTPESSIEKQLNKNVKVFKCERKGILKHFFRALYLLKILHAENITKIVSFAKQGTYLAIFSRLFYTSRGIPIIYRMVSVEEEINNSRFYLIKKVKHFLYVYVLCRNVKSIISQSNAMTESFSKRIPESIRKKIITINNLLPVDNILLKAQETTNIKFDFLLFVGRLTEEKNIEKIIYAYHHIHNRIKEKLVIIGEGILKKELRCLIKKLDLAEKVILLGYQENPYKYLAKAKALILFSRYEGMPNVVLESMLCKTPVIVSDFKGVKDLVIDEVTGLIVTGLDIQLLSNKMKYLIGKEQLQKNICNEAYKYILGFNELSIKNYSKILN